MILKSDDRILFTGDSITDCGRSDEHPFGLNGYVVMTAARLQAHFATARLHLFNRGISGNRALDLLGRLDADLIELRPTVVSIMVGINDTWRRYDSNDPTPTADYEAQLRSILTRIRRELQSRVVLIEPFVLPVPADRAAWREDLNPRIDAVRRLAVEFCDRPHPARRPAGPGRHAGSGRVLGARWRAPEPGGTPAHLAGLAAQRRHLLRRSGRRAM